DFKTYTRQCRVQPATNETRALIEAATKLLREWRAEQPRARVRLLGVAARDLTSVPQLELFASPERVRDRHLDATIDDIRAKLGSHARNRGSTLRATRQKQRACPTHTLPGKLRGHHT